MRKAENLKGRIFGNLEVIDISDVRRGTEYLWKCKCLCGHILLRSRGQLIRDCETPSCRRCRAKTNARKLIGSKFGELEILEVLESSSHGATILLCRCDCGKDYSCPLGELNRKDNPKSHCNDPIHRMQSKHAGWTGYGLISGSHFKRIEGRAKKNQIPFNITIEYIWDLYIKQNGKCAISNLDINFANSNYEEFHGAPTASLDRIDSSKGYIEGNVQWVHKHVNIMKWTLDINYFIKICKMIAENN